MNLKRNTYLIFGASVLFLLFVAWFLFTVISEINNNSETAQIIKFTSEEKIIRKKYESLLLKQFERTESLREQFKSIFLTKDDVVEFIKEIESIARHRGIFLHVKSIRKSTQSIDFYISTHGSFDSINLLLTDFENLDKASYVSGVSLSRTPGKKIWKAEYIVSVFKYNE